jgi:hypothetical protein
MKGDTFRRHVRDGKTNEGYALGSRLSPHTRVHRARTLASSLAFLFYVGKKGGREPGGNANGNGNGNGGMTRWWTLPRRTRLQGSPRVVLTCPFQYIAPTSYRTGSSQVMSHPVAPRRGHTRASLNLSPLRSAHRSLILLRRNFRCACATTRPARSCVKARARSVLRDITRPRIQDVIYYVAQRLGVKKRRSGIGTDPCLRVFQREIKRVTSQNSSYVIL